MKDQHLKNVSMITESIKKQGKQYKKLYEEMQNQGLLLI